MAIISSTLQAVKERIADAARNSGRNPDKTRLLAVSKTFPAEAVRTAWEAGQQDFGESYLQEALDKIKTLRELPLEWHFIGPIQSNKTRPIAEHFSWVHSIDRLKIAERLSAARPADLPDLQVCLQVNISDETSKSGVTPTELPLLVKAVARLPRLTLRGLMAIPEPTDDMAVQRRRFAQLRELLEQLNTQGFTLDTLSMGMSDDLEAAVAEGATIVRVGGAIFGTRKPKDFLSD